MGEFIRLYLTRYERWASPLYLVGESYGTTRAAGLAGYLIDRGIAFSGILLVSSILNFQTALVEKGNDLPYILHLPTYAAAAWYHKKLAPDLQADLQTTLREVEIWAAGEYTLALMKGDALTPEERLATIEKLARYTAYPNNLSMTATCALTCHIFARNYCALKTERWDVWTAVSRGMMPAQSADTSNSIRA